jgi:hypothetical protein
MMALVQVLFFLAGIVLFQAQQRRAAHEILQGIANQVLFPMLSRSLNMCFIEE